MVEREANVAGSRADSKVHLGTYVPKDDAEREALSLLREKRAQYIIVDHLKKLRDLATGMTGYVKRSEFDQLVQKIRDQQQNHGPPAVGG